MSIFLTLGVAIFDMMRYNRGRKVGTMEAKEKEANNLRRARMERGLSQEEVARAIGVSRPTYINIEAGKKELTVSQVEELDHKFGISFNEIIGIVEDEEEDILEVTEKYKQMILNMIKYGADDDGKITKTKLAKLVYLADFIYYYETLKPMSGVEYRKLPRGPVADLYFRVLDELDDDGLIMIEPHGRALMISLVENETSKNRLSESEIDLIRRLGKAWKNKSTDEIVEFTHRQAPWEVCFDGEILPYSMFYQNEKDVIYGPLQEVSS